MGIGVAVHGIIETPGWGKQQPSMLAYKHNKAIIRALPEFDEHWPYIVRSMFALPLYRTDLAMTIPQYEMALIHFAASYKDMFILSADWIVKFESILHRLCAFRAVAYCNWMKTRYEWTAKWEQDDILHVPPIPPKQWTLQCYESEEKEIPFSKAIEGQYPRARD